jgi:hypothetical protein
MGPISSSSASGTSGGTSSSAGNSGVSQSLSGKLNWFGAGNIARAFSRNPQAAIQQYNLTSEEVSELRNMLPNMP